MSRWSSDRSVTPEAVEVGVDTAGLGSRTVAATIDTAIQVAIAIPVLIAAAALGLTETAALVFLSTVLFLDFWAYYPLFESRWNGQTPGKRAVGIRVVQTDGQPVNVVRVLVRNLIRIVDVFLLSPLGVLSILVTAKSQRLGDLAAGTIVVREHQAPLPVPQASYRASTAEPGRGIDTSAVTEPEYDLIRSFLARRDALDLHARAAVAQRLAGPLRPRLGGTGIAELADEPLLEAVARSYRDRFRPRP